MSYHVGYLLWDWRKSYNDELLNFGSIDGICTGLKTSYKETN